MDTPTPDPRSLFGLTALVVADEPAALRATAYRLGLAVAWATDATAALGAQPLDAVLVDAGSARPDGPSAARAIRALAGPARDVPMIAIAADAGLARACLEAGADAVVADPTDAARLAAALAPLFADRPAPPPAGLADPCAALPGPLAALALHPVVRSLMDAASRPGGDPRPGGAARPAQRAADLDAGPAALSVDGVRRL